MLERWDDDFVFEQVGWSEEGVGPWLGDLHSAFNKLFLLCVSLCAGGARVVVEVFPYTSIWRILFPYTAHTKCGYRHRDASDNCMGWLAPMETTHSSYCAHS